MKTKFFLVALLVLAAVLVFMDPALATPGALLAPVAAATIPDGIKAELERINATASQRVDELQARVTSAEQVVAQLAQSGGIGGAEPVGRIGASAVEKLGEDAAFLSAAEAARQGKQIGSMNCRINLDSSIRAALTNDGAGSSDSSSYPTQPYRNPNIITGGLRPLRLLDVMPSRPTSSDAFEYIQLNVTGDASEQVLEGDEKAEIDFDGELLNGAIATIAAHTTASKQVLADNAGLMAAIDRVVRHKVLSRLEHQLINGPGGQGKIQGLLDHATAFVPTIGTTPADIVGESLVRQANNGYLPNLILMNPLDWYRLQITKTETEGEYLFGSPNMPVPPALWNASVVSTPSIPEGTGLTVDTRFTTVLDREQMSVMVTNTHKDYFTRNLVKILGELRAGLEVTDAWAVYKFDLAFSSGP